LQQWSLTPTVYRAWAGQYGVEQGLTTFRRYDVHGRPEYFDPPVQSAFRHVFVHAALYLDRYNREINLGASSEAAHSAAGNWAFFNGAANEFLAANERNQHLRDYWNNEEGIRLARSLIASGRQSVANAELATEAANMVRQSSEAPPGEGSVIVSHSDPRILDPSLYDASRLPTSGTFVPESVREAFPQRFGRGSVTAPRCFLAGTPILMADGQEKPIEDIRVGDMVMSFDPSADQGRGALVPKPVSRTFQNITRSIIDLRGLHMTPGHVCLTDDGRFETIAEILLRDGILIEADGTRIRARTGAKIGSLEDIPVLIAYPDEKTGKEIFVRARAGIPCCLVRERDGTMRHLSLALMLRAYHQTLTPDGLIQSPDGSLGEATDWPEDSTPMDEDYRRNWVIQTADGKPYVPEWILEVASEAREEQTVGATMRRIISPPSQRFAPKVVDNPTPPARNRAERRAQKHRGPK
jgi:hypothetical protein